MRETLLKTLFVLIAAGIAVPLLLSVWPNKPTTLLKQQSDSSLKKVTLTDPNATGTSFTLEYPAAFRENQSTISNTTDEFARQLLTLDTFPANFEGGSDAPFDGMSIAIATTMSFSDFIEKEKMNLAQGAENMGETPTPGLEKDVTYAGLSGLMITGYGWDGLTRVYLPIGDTEQVIVVGINEKEPGSFMPQAEGIINSIDLK